MNRFLLFCLTVTLFAGSFAAFSAEGEKAPLRKQNKTKGYIPAKLDYTIFQLSLWDYDYMMLFSPNGEVRGLNIGIQSMNSSKGVSISCSQEAESVAGITVVPLLLTEESSLFHLTLFGHVLSNKALAIGIYNRSYYNHFLQIGCFNDATRTSIGQIGIWNQGPGRKDNSGRSAFQIGFMNSADCGLQIGLFNYNKNSILPYTLLFNFSSPAKNKVENKKITVKK